MIVAAENSTPVESAAFASTRHKKSVMLLPGAATYKFHCTSTYNSFVFCYAKYSVLTFVYEVRGCSVIPHLSGICSVRVGNY